MDVSELVTPARIALSLTVVGFVVASLLALRGGDTVARIEAAPLVRALAAWAVLAGIPAVVLSHGALVPVGRALLPVGVFVGLALAVASNLWAPARRAFDALGDGEVRSLLGYRATFGAFLFAGAALGLFPPLFAWTAGLGDLAVTWLAHVAPGSLASRGPRGWRFLVHGWGLLDLVEVVVLAMTVVRPWLAEHDSLGPPLLLPWLGVPLMLALNLHGLRRAFSERASDDGREPSGAAVDGPEPPRGVRSAVG